MIDRLSVPEGTGRLLDNSVVFCTNEHGPGTEDWIASHNAICMPYVLVGSCGGFFKTGRSLLYGDATKIPYEKGYMVYTGGPMTGKSPAGESVWWGSHGDRPYSNQLFVSLMNAMGVPGDEFGEVITVGPEKQVIPASMTRGPLPRLRG